MNKIAQGDALSSCLSVRQTLDGNGWSGMVRQPVGLGLAQGQVCVGAAEHSWVVRGDCWDDIKETQISPASPGRLFCGMKDLGKSNCFFFASSYVKHTQSPHRNGISAAGDGEAKGN